MTVTYTSEVATCTKFGTFWKLLFRWRGSIYKLVWPELCVYTLLYYICSIVYRFLLDDPQRRVFEKVSLYCQYFSDLIPVSFVLGFYVSVVVQRWWNQYLSLPWPDSLALFISTSIHGQDERSRLMRRTVMRYVNLAELLTLIMISPTVKKRFPTHNHIVESGFMTENEQKIFDDLDTKTPHPKYWMPLVWAGTIVTRARKEGRIRDDFAVKTIIDEINRFRGLCGSLLSYDWISIPLVYTQVVTLSVYTFFLGTIMGRQFLDPTQGIPKQEIDFYVPVFTFLQFFFYMGWLKVAESLVNPFGEDDDDFEVNWLVDRNLQVSYLIVDEMHSEHPELIQDKYWDEIFPTELPYTIAAEQFRIDPPQGSTANIEVPEVDQEFLPLVEEEEEEEDEGLPRTGADDIQDLENGDTKGVDIKAPGSARSSVSGSAPQQSASRKPSVLSMIVQRMKIGSTDNLRQRSVKPHGSTTSMRQAKKSSRGFGRSASRMSTTSHNTSESIQKNATVLTQGSAIFRMSDLSLNTTAREAPSSPRTRAGNYATYDDDEPIHIKIKRRDKDGRVISPTEEYDNASESSRTRLIPKLKKPGSRLFSYESMSDEVEDNATAKVDQADNKSLGSSCSIRTSIFQAEDDDDGDIDEDERIAALVHTRRKRGIMKSLLGAFSKIRNSQQSEEDTPAPYTVSNWLNSDGNKVGPEKSSEEQAAHVVSASVPVSQRHGQQDYGRTAKSLGTRESLTFVGSKFLKPLTASSPISMETGKSDDKSKFPFDDSSVSSVLAGNIALTPIESDVSGNLLLDVAGDTKIDIVQAELDDPSLNVPSSSQENAAKTSEETSADVKLAPVTEEELEAIAEVEQNMHDKGEMWV